MSGQGGAAAHRKKGAAQKGGAQVQFVDVRDPFPADFLGFLYALPSDDTSHDDADGAEPPKKRARVERIDAIPIARHSFTLNRPAQSEVLTPKPISRSNIHRYMKLKCDHHHGVFSLSSTTRSRYGAFKVDIQIPGMDSDTTIVDVLNQTHDDEGEEGALWVSVAINLETSHDRDFIKFEFVLNWNSSTSASRSLSQRALSQQVLDTFFGSRTQVLDTTDEQLLPRAFYEAAFLPEKGHTDVPISPPRLTSNLFPFQRRALQWLLNREGVKWTDHCANGEPGLEPLPAPSTTSLPLSFSTAKDVYGQSVYVSSLYHVMTRDITPFRMIETTMRGGILAEEMGLGKTVEMISLICTHTRENLPGPSNGAAQDPRPSGATLIVTPRTLRNQWTAEFTKHAPDLRVMVYGGLKGFTGDPTGLVSELATHDVVITTYDVLQHEIHHAEPPPSRSMRNAPKYHRAKSPLVQISWWRVCLDEAQQIESGVSGAAKLARLIPRINAWGVTGTPVKGNIKDLWGLLVFLHYEPFASFPAVWDALLASHKEFFKPLFNRITLRHTKRAVRDELTLPPQKRYVITIPFTAVEEEHYRAQFSELAASCGFDKHGVHIPRLYISEWIRKEKMKRALANLRRSILHPSLGPGLQRVGGKNKSPPTVEETLEMMIEQSESTIRANQRLYLVSMLRRGQILGTQLKLEAAIEIWQQVVDEVEVLIDECRKQMEDALEKARQAGSNENLEEAETGPQAEDDANKSKLARQIGDYRRKLRSMLDIKHRAVFFIASACYQLKVDQNKTAPNSEGFRTLEDKEVAGYAVAKEIRKEMLRETHTRVMSCITKLREKAESQSFVEIPQIEIPPFRGLESARIVDTFQLLRQALDEQANMIDELREAVIQMLIQPLVDEEGDADTTGEEFDASTKLQDELMVYTLVLRTLIEDRKTVVTGQENLRTTHEAATAETRAKDNEGHAPEKTLTLLARRSKIKRSLQGITFRSIIASLRELATNLRSDGGSNRAMVELEIVERLLRSTTEENTEQNKAVEGLLKELDAFTTALNSRVEYYRQLQSVSDALVPPNVDKAAGPDGEIKALLQGEESSRGKVALYLPKHRYLVYLKEAGQLQEEECVICQCSFTDGTLTICGHQFCRECLRAWLRGKHTCPVCKTFLARGMTYDITLKKQELKVRQEHQENSQERSRGSDEAGLASKPRKTGIYSEIDSDMLQAIKSIEVGAPSFATKVNTLARHLLWLRVQDPGAKSVIFSQFSGFLEILARAFDEYRIGYSSSAKKNSIKTFKEDPAIECFLMDAKAHASGLNLVNASHVFLCEPLLNTALELQAIARVDRIGQVHPTTVWLYLIEDTVEESIYNLSVQRRLKNMEDSKGKSREATEITDLSIEDANSMEVEQASLSKLMNKDQSLGEAIDDDDDLWQCLFGHVTKQDELTAAVDDRMNDPAVMGFLAGEAAEARRQGGQEEEGVTNEARNEARSGPMSATLRAFRGMLRDSSHLQ
ncbi:hypothetical protein F5Y06DRAFT_263990 [Hypoxylon sp. FL0890]|nr:hypothetical protein F5Y06DRAFT_263990 [Hypoxylon sp. FL0890]